MGKILLKRGLKANLPKLDNGEPGFTTDTNEVFVGNGTSNLKLAMMSDLEKVYTTTNSGNAYSITVPNISALSDGLPLAIKFNVASTGNITLNVNGLGAKNVIDYFGTQVSNVRANLIVNLRYESTSGSFTLLGKGGDGTATASQILNGQTATTKNGLVTGSMQNKDGVTSAWSGYENISVQPHPSDSAQGLVTVPNAYNVPGYYGNSSKITGNLANLNSSNIKAGVVVGRINGDSSNSIVGTFTSDANATASDIANGKIAYVNGNKIVGTSQASNSIDLGKTQFNTSVIVNDTSHYALWRIKFDSAGNYYTVGRGNDAYVRKFSPNGTMLWQTPTNGQAFDIALDRSETYIYTAEDGYSVRKLACSNGAQSWVYYDPTNQNWIYAVDVDSAGNVYAGGMLGKIYKLDPNGNLQLTINAGNTSNTIHTRSLAIDTSNNIWVAVGNYIYKYSSSGTKLDYFTASNVAGLVIDSLDNIYFIQDGVSGFKELRVMDSLGKGSKRYVGVNINAIDVSKSTNTIVISMKDSYYDSNAYIHKFDSELRQIGSIRFAAPDGTISVAISKDGIIATADNISGTTLYKMSATVLQ